MSLRFSRSRVAIVRYILHRLIRLLTCKFTERIEEVAAILRLKGGIYLDVKRTRLKTQSILNFRFMPRATMCGAGHLYSSWSEYLCGMRRTAPNRPIL